MKFEIKNKFNGAVLVAVAIDCAEDSPIEKQLGKAVEAALSRWADLREADLRGANLRWANLQGANLRWADLRWANLQGAKLQGADLQVAKLQGADLQGANLRWADLRWANLRWADLRGADLREADLRWADLRGADLREAKLQGANLQGANLREAKLQGADLREAKLQGADLIAAPIVQNIDAAILDAINGGGKIEMDRWHTCDTTHCRAGWAITLAGEAGKKLEAKTTPYLAGRLIYEASRPGVPCPDFFASNDDAMADLRKCAEAGT